MNRPNISGFYGEAAGAVDEEGVGTVLVEQHAVIESRRRRVPGVEGVWILIAGDMLIFALLFGTFMKARLHDPAVFESARQTLDYDRGGINTLLLITSSWCVVQALHALRGGRRRLASNWLLGAVVGGACFVASKVSEYNSEIAAGHTATSTEFHMYYFVITGIHLLHVLIGMSVLTFFWFRWRKGLPESTAGFEAAAIFWHMVDLLWIFIFPLLYLVR